MARPFQFRLRTIFWLVALVAVACVAAPSAVRRYRDYQQEQEIQLRFQRAVDSVKRAGY
ncbi:MAG: hypothetical protein WD847_10700 [Pirellulales bacterium]